MSKIKIDIETNSSDFHNKMRGVRDDADKTAKAVSSSTKKGERSAASEVQSSSRIRKRTRGAELRNVKKGMSSALGVIGVSGSILAGVSKTISHIAAEIGSTRNALADINKLNADRNTSSVQRGVQLEKSAIELYSKLTGETKAGRIVEGGEQLQAQVMRGAAAGDVDVNDAMAAVLTAQNQYSDEGGAKSTIENLPELAMFAKGAGLDIETVVKDFFNKKRFTGANDKEAMELMGIARGQDVGGTASVQDMAQQSKGFMAGHMALTGGTDMTPVERGAEIGAAFQTVNATMKSPSQTGTSLEGLLTKYRQMGKTNMSLTQIVEELADRFGSGEKIDSVGIQNLLKEKSAVDAAMALLQKKDSFDGLLNVDSKASMRNVRATAFALDQSKGGKAASLANETKQDDVNAFGGVMDQEAERAQFRKGLRNGNLLERMVGKTDFGSEIAFQGATAMQKNAEAISSQSAGENAAWAGGTVATGGLLGAARILYVSLTDESIQKVGQATTSAQGLSGRSNRVGGAAKGK